jgi:hypothetical protein
MPRKMEHGHLCRLREKIFNRPSELRTANFVALLIKRRFNNLTIEVPPSTFMPREQVGEALRIANAST